MFHARLARQSDASAGGNNPLPWQPVRLTQCPDDLSRGSRKSGSAGNRAVSRDFAARYFQNGGANLGKHRSLFLNDRVVALIGQARARGFCFFHIGKRPDLYAK